MTSRTILVKEDYISGETGLLLKGIRQIDTFMVTTSGLLIAHDLLEHQNGLSSIGSIDDELEALGGAWYVRGCLNRIGNGYHTPHKHLASDVCELGRIFMEGVEFRTKVPNTRPCDEDQDFEDIVHEGMDDLRSEFECTSYAHTIRRDKYKSAAMHYIRSGYNKAKRRYDSSDMAYRMFYLIEEAVDKVIEHEELYAGQEFILTYDKCHANVRQREEEYW